MTRAGTAPQSPRACLGSKDDTNKDQACEEQVPTLPSRSSSTQCALPVGSHSPPQVIFTFTLGHEASSQHRNGRIPSVQFVQTHVTCLEDHITWFPKQLKIKLFLVNKLRWELSIRRDLWMISLLQEFCLAPFLKNVLHDRPVPVPDWSANLE